METGVLRLPLLILILLAGIAVSSETAAAQSDTIAADSGSDEWSFRLAPYAWATAISGDTGVAGADTHVDLSIGNVLEHVDGGVTADFEADKGRWSIIGDIVYASLSDSRATPRGIVFSDADLDLQEIIWTQLLGYTFYQNDCVSLDITGGFRLVSLDIDLEIEGAALPGRDFSKDETWIDPVIGARGRVYLADRFFLTGRGDVGGFGASSEFTWQMWGALAYEVKRSAAVGFGYRALGYEHNRNGLKFDLDMHGPFIGAEFRF